jgi:hypothetical protein
VASGLTRCVLEAAHCWEESDADRPAAGQAVAAGRQPPDVRFAHSPGRLDPAYLGNLGSFDVAFILELGDGADGILGLVTRYHERVERRRPKPARLPRYVELTERSGVFASGAIPAVNGTRLRELWLDHLLVESMLQHESGRRRWGRFVQVHPVGTSTSSMPALVTGCSSTPRRSHRRAPRTCSAQGSCQRRRPCGSAGVTYPTDANDAVEPGT